MKENVKNCKAAEALVDECTKKGDTCLVLYVKKDSDNGFVGFTGDHKELSDALYSAVFHKSCTSDAKAQTIGIANSFLNAIMHTLADEDDDVCTKFNDIMIHVAESALALKKKRTIEKICEDADLDLSDNIIHAILDSMFDIDEVLKKSKGKKK